MTKTWIKSLFTFALALCAGLAYAAEVVSLNFYSDQGAVGTDAQAGLESAGGWNNLTGASGTAFLNIWDGTTTSESTVFLSYSSNNGYQYITENTEMYLRGYLDDGGNQVSMTVLNVPFSKYDVIVYTATDTESRLFKPVKINGTWYAGSAEASEIGYAATVTEENKDATTWGASRSDSAAYGTNALRVNGLSGDLTINGGTNSNNARGGIAAVQIINTGDAISLPAVKIEGVVNATNIEWPAEPAADKTVMIAATAEATVTLDESIPAALLVTYGESIKFTGGGALTATETLITADTDVSEVSGTLSLGAVKISSGKKLTVLQTNVCSSIERSANSILKITGDIGYLPLVDNTVLETSGNVVLEAAITETIKGRSWVLSGGVSSVPAFYLAAGAEWSNSGNRSYLTLKDGAQLTVTGDASSIGDQKTSGAMMFAECGNGSEVSISGSGTELKIPNGALNLSRDGVATATVSDGALLQAYKLGGIRNNSVLTINGATLVIGKSDVSDGIIKMTTCKLVLDNATLSAAGDWAVATDSSASQIEVSNTLTVTPNGKTIVLRNMTLTDGAELVVTGEGRVDCTGISGQFSSISVSEGATLVLPAGKEGAATVADGASLTLVLDDTQFATKYDASGISGSGSVSFARLDSEGTLVPITAGVDGKVYTYPTPTWTPVDANSTWDTSGCWSTTTGAAPDSGSIVLNTLELGADISVTIPSSFDSITVVGGAEATTTVLLGSTASVPSSLTVMGKVKLPIDAINNVTTLNVYEGAVLIADVASEATLAKALSGNYAFWKDGEGTLTLGANVVANNGCAVQKGTLKLGGDGCWIGAASSYTTAGNVTVAPNATFDLNGTANSFLNTVTLGEGSVLCNNGGEIPTTSRQLRGISLTGNAIVDVKNNFGLLANSHTQTTLTLNGYTLTKTGSGSFWLTNTLAPDGIGGRFRIKEGTLYAYHSGSVLNDIHLSVEGNSTLSLNARLSGLASLKFRAGNGGVNFTGVANLDAGIRPTLDAAFVNPETLSIGDEVTLITDGASVPVLTNIVFSSIAVGGRFSTTNVTAGKITATVGALTNFWHYSFDGAGVTEESSRAPDSRYAVGGWGDVNGADKNVNSRNGRAACLYFADNANRFSAYWNNNTAGVSPFYAGVATITSVVKPRETGKKVIWGLGSGINANIDCVALVVDDATTMSLVTKSGTPLVTVRGINDLTKSYHFVTAVFTPDGTTLTVDDITETSNKVVPSTIDGRGQLGSVHGGVPTGYERQGATGCYLDDWVVYDALLTEGELEALRTTFCPRPFYIRMR